MTWHKQGDTTRGGIVTAGILAAHGGAGATTLARALQLPELHPAAAAHASVVVLAAAGHAHGARRVIETVAELGEYPHVVLALTGTGWGHSAETRAMRRLLADRLEAVVDLPWVWRWHHQPTPTAATATDRWRAAAVDLATLVEGLSLHHPITHHEGAHLP